jgi:hypothetical protein
MRTNNHSYELLAEAKQPMPSTSSTAKNVKKYLSTKADNTSSFLILLLNPFLLNKHWFQSR